VRQIFYLATVRGLVSKDEGGYDRVQIDLVEMRRSGQLPYGWIVDHTRWQRRRVTFNSIDEALADTARRTARRFGATPIPMSRFG